MEITEKLGGSADVQWVMIDHKIENEWRACWLNLCTDEIVDVDTGEIYQDARF